VSDRVLDPGFAYHDRTQDPASPPIVDTVDTNGHAPLSSLDDLRLALEQSDAVAQQEFEDYILFGPGKVIRLTCSTDLAQHDLKSDQLAAIPRAYRRKRMPDATKMNEAEALGRVIGRQTLEIALRQADGSYRAMPGTFADANILTAFGAAEVHVAVGRVFANDAYLIRAGEELLEACGYGETRPGDGGPT
jgi:hypothetical protein